MSIFTVADILFLAVLLTGIESKPTEDDFRCPKPRGYFAHKIRCDLYYICYGGDFTLESCRKGQLFDDDYKRCLAARSTECGDRIEPTDESYINFNDTESNNTDWTTVSNDQVKTSHNSSWTNETSEPHYTTGHEEWNATTIHYTKTTIVLNETTDNISATGSESVNKTTIEAESTTAYNNWSSSQDEVTNKTSSPWHTTEHGELNITTNQPSSSSNSSEVIGNSSITVEDTSRPGNDTGVTTANTPSSTVVMNITSSPWNTTEQGELNITTTQYSSTNNWSEASTTVEDTARPGNQTGFTTPNTTSTTEEITDEPSEEEIDCPEESGLFPHPSDPSMYIHCSAWFPHVKKCPANLVFDPDLSVCAWPKYRTY